jgi:uncharacterized protein YycO
MRKMLLWIMQTRGYAWLMLKVVPYVRFTTYYTSLRGWKYHSGYKILQPGDILVTVDKRKLTTLLVPGTWTHAAFCITKDGVWEISEMTHENYTKSCFFDICKEADRVAVYRPQVDDAYKQKMIDTCKTFVDAKYDLEFELGIKALYCSELVYESDVDDKLGFDLSDIAGLGRPYISPDGITKGKNVKCVWDSDKI